MHKILLVEDDLSFAHLIENFLKRKDYDVATASHLKAASEYLSTGTFDLLLLDFNLPDGNAFDLIDLMQKKGLRTPIIIMTRFNDVKTAVKAMQLGVSNYITKPVNHEELSLVIGEALKVNTFVPTANIELQNDFIKGKSKTSLEFQKLVDLVAPTDMSVIIQGESGTGKEHAARSIHQQSNRSKGKFVAIDCGALSDELAASEFFGHKKGAFTGAVSDKRGEFESANGGTLFLDEIGNLSYQVQIKLLRAIQERVIQPIGGNEQIKVDVRIIVATNEDLKKKVADGSFREDLYHRLNEFAIALPPLREREDDLEEFVQYFIKKSDVELGKNVKGVSSEVLSVFKKYKWPGNLRELKNIVRRGVLLTQENIIGTSDLPQDMLVPVYNEAKDPGNDLKMTKEVSEKQLIVKILTEMKYNKTKTAAALNIDRKTLYLKMARYGIEG